MFGLENMLIPYDERMVARFENDETGLVVSTAAVFDTSMPFETAVMHPRYHDGKWVIVKQYHDRESAEQGHEKWVQVMSAAQLPTVLEEIGDNIAAKMMRELGDAMVFEADCSEDVAATEDGS